MTIKTTIRQLLNKLEQKRTCREHFKKYIKYAFTDKYCAEYNQFDASIIRLYHTIEKGLSFENYRAGFGKENINTLVSTMEKYSTKFDTEAFVYRTALSVLFEYIRKNKEYGHEDVSLESRIKNLPGSPNNLGGVIKIEPNNCCGKNWLDYATFVKSRHSVRSFSDEPVSIDLIRQALEIAQHTPSACNRQGWRTRVIASKDIIEIVLKNQNGNRGFGMRLDKLLVITFDLRYSNIVREVFQGYIDGGMYAMSVLNGLHSMGLATIPLSAALTHEQESNIRQAINMHDAEVFILIIGVGNYLNSCTTTRSERKPVVYDVL